jgi:hypothetical protein
MEETSVVAAADTKTNDLTKTQHFSPNELADAATELAATNGAEKVAVAQAKTSDSKAGLAGKKSPGKLPPIPTVATKDSREAAAEMLKKILRNR